MVGHEREHADAGGGLDIPPRSETGFCWRCRELHKHHCETTNQVDGRFLCVFCEDNISGSTEEVCPQVDLQTRLLEVQKKRVGDRIKERAERNFPIKEKVPSRVCEHEGCAKVLKKNQPTYCAEHRDLHKPEGPRCAGDGCGRKLRFKQGEPEREFCRQCEKQRAAQVEARVEETMAEKKAPRMCTGCGDKLHGRTIGDLCKKCRKGQEVAGGGGYQAA